MDFSVNKLSSINRLYNTFIYIILFEIKIQLINQRKIRFKNYLIFQRNVNFNSNEQNNILLYLLLYNEI